MLRCFVLCVSVCVSTVTWPLIVHTYPFSSEHAHGHSGKSVLLGAVSMTLHHSNHAVDTSMTLFKQICLKVHAVLSYLFSFVSKII